LLHSTLIIDIYYHLIKDSLLLNLFKTIRIKIWKGTNLQFSLF